MKQLAVVLAMFTCGAAFAADASDPERLKEARALLVSMHVERQLESSTSAMSKAMANSLVARYPGLNPRAAQIFMDETMAGTKEYAQEPGGFLDVIAEFYATEFTLDEMRQIRAYYESPAGRHMVDAQAKLLQQALPKVTDGMRSRVPAICERAKARLLAEGFEGSEKITCPAPGK
ncbi:MAG TPA: DUF2059 domain-containing protein [Usitatibacter sp.]